MENGGEVGDWFKSSFVITNPHRCGLGAVGTEYNDSDLSPYLYFVGTYYNELTHLDWIIPL